MQELSDEQIIEELNRFYKKSKLSLVLKKIGRIVLTLFFIFCIFIIIGILLKENPERYMQELPGRIVLCIILGFILFENIQNIKKTSHIILAIKNSIENKSWIILQDVVEKVYMPYNSNDNLIGTIGTIYLTENGIVNINSKHKERFHSGDSVNILTIKDELGKTYSTNIIWLKEDQQNKIVSTNEKIISNLEKEDKHNKIFLTDEEIISNLEKKYLKYKPFIKLLLTIWLIALGIMAIIYSLNDSAIDIDNINIKLTVSVSVGITLLIFIPLLSALKGMKIIKNGIESWYITNDRIKNKYSMYHHGLYHHGLFGGRTTFEIVLEKAMQFTVNRYEYSEYDVGDSVYVVFIKNKSGKVSKTLAIYPSSKYEYYGTHLEI